MGLTERREREKIALRQEILEAATELFAQEGYESVSMRKIAEKIEYSPTTIYLYFQDKEELIEEICEQTFARLAKKLQKVTAAPGDPVEKLKAGLRCYVEFGLKYADQYRVTLMTPHHHCDEKMKDELAGTHGGEAFDYLIQAVASCIEAGRFRETDVMAASQALWVTIHGLTAALIIHLHFPWVERNRLIDLTIGTAVRGLLA
jgi:AcrR family transcriptional regulator